MGKKLTTQEFIVKSIAIHGEKYDYSKVEYINAHSKVKIICRSHGEFMQAPTHHTQGKGCNLCGNISIGKSLSMSNSSFIAKSKILHGNKYDYSKTDYKLAHEKVTIICPKHGEFQQTPAIHLRSYGCKKCGDEMTGRSLMKSKSEFTSKAKLIHGDKYDYRKVEYNGAHKKVSITCPLHGVFTQTPDAHVNIGCGCPQCAVHGFKDNESASLYVLRSSCGRFIKIGISNEISVRLRKLSRTTPFDFNLIEKFKSLGSNIRFMESKFHKVFGSAGFKGFDGATEWFHYDSEKLEQLKNYGESIK